MPPFRFVDCVGRTGYHLRTGFFQGVLQGTGAGSTRTSDAADDAVMPADGDGPAAEATTVGDKSPGRKKKDASKKTKLAVCDFDYCCFLPLVYCDWYIV